MLSRCAAAGVIAVMLAGCYVQQPLPRPPTYVPASWEPIMGLRTSEGEEIVFDEPGTIESGQVVYRVDGTQASMSLDDIDQRVFVERTLDKKKTLLVSLAVIVSLPLGFIMLYWAHPK